METKNRTPEDAHARIVQAQIGAHVEATDTFLVALRAKLYLWIAQIDAELAKRDLERARRLEAQEEEESEGAEDTDLEYRDDLMEDPNFERDFDDGIRHHRLTNDEI